MKQTYAGLRIEWDDEKNILNERKHGIGFAEAARIFLDDNRLEIYDEKYSGEEERYITIGLVYEVLFVVYTERAESLRIISARLATKEEEELYYGYGGN